LFGGLWKQSTISYAVYQYFLNGGSDALIVRVINGGVKTKFENRTEKGITFKAANEGQWANALRITIDNADKNTKGRKSLFNIRVKEKTGNSGDPKKDYVELESFLNVSFVKNHTRNVRKVLKESSLVRVRSLSPRTRPRRKLNFDVVVRGDDGNDLQDADLVGDKDKKTGIYALDKADTFNILCIPSPSLLGQPSRSGLYTNVYTNAAEYCEKRRAILIVDPPSDWTSQVDPTSQTIGIDNFGLARSENATIYFPRIKAPDPLDSNQAGLFSPCGAVAGIIAKTDMQRGVWKAPAGADAVLSGTSDLQIHLTDQDNATLNRQGINCLRILLPAGIVIWGARTMMGAENLASQWKYLPVRRLALYIEESLYRGTKWTVFEPNDEKLWSDLRLNVGAFMQDLFRKGAFQGSVPKEAYFVKCDNETTTQTDIDRGIVNIIVGFAPLRKSEFIILKIQQQAGLQKLQS
jgi:phage tail sheath protein FI